MLLPLFKNDIERRRARQYVGWIYWTYDTDEQERLWNGMSGRGLILNRLKAIR